MRTPALLFAAMLGLGSAVLSQTPGNNSIQLRGIVRDAETGQPLPKISVWDGEKTIVTDAAGRFTLAGLSAGRLRINASGNGYLLDGLSDPKSTQRTAYRSSGVYVTIPPENPTEITLYMRPSPFVVGTVLDSFGQPVFGAMVTSHRLFYDSEGKRTLRRQLASETDDRGQFETESLPPGDYVFRAEKLRTETDPRLPLLPASSSSIAIGPGSSRVPPLIMASGAGARLRVRVVNETGVDPLGYTSFSIRRQEDLSSIGLLTSGLAGGSPRLPQGSYVVEVSVRENRNADPFSDTISAFVSRVTVDIRDADIEVPVTLSRGTRVEGRVVKQEKNGVLSSLAGIRIQVGSLLSASSGNDGTFAFSSAPHDTYPVRPLLYNDEPLFDFVRERELLTSPRGLCFSEVRQNDAPIPGGSVKIAGASTFLTVVVRDSTTRIHGKVVDSAGRAVNSAVVALVPDDRRQTLNYFSMIADQNGDFEFTCATAGNYRLFAWPDLPGAAYRNEEFMAGYKDRGTSVRLSDGAGLSVKTELIEQ